MPASDEMKSLFRRAQPEAARHARSEAPGNRYCTRVLTEAERPLGARTVVVQLLKTVRIRTAAIVGKRIAFIMVIRVLNFPLIRRKRGK